MINGGMCVCVRVSWGQIMESCDGHANNFDLHFCKWWGSGEDSDQENDEMN